MEANWGWERHARREVWRSNARVDGVPPAGLNSRALSLRDEEASKAKTNSGVKKHSRSYLEQCLKLLGETTERKTCYGRKD